MEQRTITFPKRCFTRAEAASTSGLFPAVTPTGNLATHTFSTMMGNMMGGMQGGMLSMSFNYTTPTALPFIMMSANFSISSGTFSNEAVQTIPLNRTSMTMQMSGPATVPSTGTGALTINATDIFGRNLGTAWMFQ
jgi:predicted lipid-binding transport protein (Tim44 family)